MSGLNLLCGQPRKSILHCLYSQLGIVLSHIIRTMAHIGRRSGGCSRTPRTSARRSHDLEVLDISKYSDQHPCELLVLVGGRHFLTHETLDAVFATDDIEMDALGPRDTTMPVYKVTIRQKTTQEMEETPSDEDDAKYIITAAQEVRRLSRAEAFAIFSDAAIEFHLEEAITSE